MIATRINDQASLEYANLLRTRLRELAGSGIYVFPSDNNLCVDVDGFEKRNSKTTQIRPCLNRDSLQWIYLPPETQIPKLMSVLQQKNLTTCVVANSDGEKLRFEISNNPFPKGHLVTYDIRMIAWRDYIPHNLIDQLRKQR